MGLEFGVWAIFPPLLTIFMAVFTRQVIVSLLIGVLAGYWVLSGFEVGRGLQSSVEGMVEVFQAEGSAKTLLFGVMVGGVIHLARFTGGMQALVGLLCDKAKVVRGPVSTQLLGGGIAALIFIESNLSLLTAGTVTTGLAVKHGVPKEQMAYVIRNTGLCVWSSMLINGWGAAMMGIIAVQVSKGFIHGEPFEILAKSIGYNFFAWASLLVIAASVLTRFDFSAMRQAKKRASEGADDKGLVRAGSLECSAASATVKGSVSNLLVPLVAMIAFVPIGLYITGGGDLERGSGSTAVLWAVLVGQIAGFFHYVFIKKVLSVETYTNELLAGYQTMVPLAVVLTLAFLIGNVSGQLNVGGYLAHHMNGTIPAGLTAAFIFVVAAVISLSTGTSWGTFSIMIPIGVQAAVAAGVEPYMVIGAAISGSLLGDAVSPISDTGIVVSMSTGAELMAHIKTQLPYCMLAGALALTAFALAGLFA